MEDRPGCISIPDVQHAVARAFCLSIGEMLSRDFNDGYKWFRACAIGARRVERGGWKAPDG